MNGPSVRFTSPATATQPNERSTRYGPTPRPLADRLAAKILVTDTCWRWLGAPGTDGYGRIAVGEKPNQRKRVVHRVLWELLYGAVPDGYDLDHTCHNADPTCPGGKTCEHRRCVNPVHLRIATRGENLRGGRGIAAEKAAQTHCVHGHILDDANVRIRRNGTRVCRTCAAERRKRYPHYRKNR